MSMIPKPGFKLPFWMSGPRATTLARVASQWWDVAAAYVRLPLTTFDVLTCELAFVDLLAFQRGIDRYAGEAEWFYRLRVHHALRNARAAGTPAGMRQIFSNLTLPEPRFTERMPNRDWDMTRVRFWSHQYWALPDEINFVLRYYWRTCRRFELVSETAGELRIGLGNGAHLEGEAAAKVKPSPAPARPATAQLALGNGAHLEGEAAAKVKPSPAPARPAAATLALGNGAHMEGEAAAQVKPSPAPARPATATLALGNGAHLEGEAAAQVKPSPAPARPATATLALGNGAHLEGEAAAQVKPSPAPARPAASYLPGQMGHTASLAADTAARMAPQPAQPRPALTHWPIGVASLGGIIAELHWSFA